MVAKFFWLLVWNKVSPTKANNPLTREKAAMVVALVVGFEIDFTHVILANIHERVLRLPLLYPFRV